MRAIWSGSLSFGLVNIPVKLYSAVSESRLDLDMLHKNDLSTIRFARVCTTEGKEIPYEEIVKGYEYEKGHYVVLTDQDFERANIRITKAISILNFTEEDKIDPIYFEKPYYLEPDKGAEKPYSLLNQSLSKSKKVGVGKFVLRNREHLVIIRPLDRMIILEQLRFKEQIREFAGLNLPGVISEKEEIEMAISLIDQLTKPFKPDDYRDTYTGELMRVIAEKAAGRIPAIKGTPPAPTPVPDIMEVLRKSLEAERDKRKRVKT